MNIKIRLKIIGRSMKVENLQDNIFKILVGREEILKEEIKKQINKN